MADNGVIYVEHQRIETCAQNLNTHQRAFVEVLSQLESDMKPMLASWTGDARNLYTEKKAQWESAAGDLVTVLGLIVTATENAFDNYCSAVAASKQAWT